jgi:hypothetical protein
MPESGTVDGAETAIPAFFYLNGKTPTLHDTGRTGFMVANLKAAENLLVVSEDQADDPVVYFYGIEGVSRVEIHFAPDANFPSGFVIHQEGLPSTMGVLSSYSEEFETFSIDLSCGQVFERYDSLVLNKSLFAAYPDQEDMTESQYLRVKNILTSLALWTAIAYQTHDTAPTVIGERNASGAYIMQTGKSTLHVIAGVFLIVAVVAMTIAVIPCLPAVIATAVGTTAATIPPVLATVQVVSGIVGMASLAGSFALEAIATFMPDEDTPSTPSQPIITIATGDRGPAGGILATKLEGTDDWFEVAPEDIGSFRIIGGEAEEACAEYSVTVDGRKIDGWYLPSSGELEFIYKYLYKAGKINCQPDFYWSSTRANATGIYYISVNFLNGDIDGANIGHRCLVLPVRRVSEDEIVAFKKGNG